MSFLGSLHLLRNLIDFLHEIASNTQAQMYTRVFVAHTNIVAQACTMSNSI